MNNATVTYKIELESVWATPREGMSLLDLSDELYKLGHKVKELDAVGNRLRIA